MSRFQQYPHTMMPFISHTIVVGAGPAGLAVGACLKQAGIPCLILEQTDKVGAAWHRHYDRLHLHTAKAYSALPFVPFPKDYPRYPSRLQVITYLEAYARQFQLELRFGQQVVAARYANGFWEVQTQDARYQALNLVIATGYNREPYLPSWPGQASFRGTAPAQFPISKWRTLQEPEGSGGRFRQLRRRDCH